MLLLKIAQDLGDPLTCGPPAYHFAVQVAAPQEKQDVTHLAFEVALETNPHLGGDEEVTMAVGFQLVTSSMESGGVQLVSSRPEALSAVRPGERVSSLERSRAAWDPHGQVLELPTVALAEASLPRDALLLLPGECLRHLSHLPTCRHCGHPPDPALVPST